MASRTETSAALAALLALCGACGGASAAATAPPRAGDGPAAEPVAPAEQPAREAELEELRAEVARLRAELARAHGERLERERDWLAWTTELARVDAAARALAPFGPQAPDVLPPPALAGAQPARAPEVDQQARERARRAAELGRALRTLLAFEGVRGLDLLEPGTLGEGCIGPVVFRLLDGHGRLSGGLYAERLRLEGSRAGRTLTLVLEEGYETRGGARSDFASDPEAERDPALPPAWRLTLPDVDPMDWLDALPELFGAGPPEPPRDDGLWSLAWVRGKLNELLREDAGAGWWRLAGLDGVVDGALRGVHLEGLDRQGRLERRLFADLLRIEAVERGVLLVLEQGVQVRGDSKAPFLDGRFRIYLPRADLAAWRAAGLPGLAPADAAAPR